MVKLEPAGTLVPIVGAAMMALWAAAVAARASEKAALASFIVLEKEKSAGLCMPSQSQMQAFYKFKEIHIPRRTVNIGSESSMRNGVVILSWLSETITATD